MIKKAWLGCVGAVLLVSSVPGVFALPGSTTAQTTVKKKKSTSSKSKKKPKVASQKAPTPDRIREIQSALQRQGAYKGEVTGKWDDATVDAMKDYQDKNGLNSTGKIDALTLQKLGLGSDTAGRGAPVAAVPPAQPVSHVTQ